MTKRQGIECIRCVPDHTGPKNKQTSRAGMSSSAAKARREYRLSRVHCK